MYMNRSIYVFSILMFWLLCFPWLMMERDSCLHGLYWCHCLTCDLKNAECIQFNLLFNTAKRNLRDGHFYIVRLCMSFISASFTFFSCRCYRLSPKSRNILAMSFFVYLGIPMWKIPLGM